MPITIGRQGSLWSLWPVSQPRRQHPGVVDHVRRRFIHLRYSPTAITSTFTRPGQRRVSRLRSREHERQARVRNAAKPRMRPDCPHRPRRACATEGWFRARSGPVVPGVVIVDANVVGLAFGQDGPEPGKGRLLPRVRSVAAIPGAIHASVVQGEGNPGNPALAQISDACLLHANDRALRRVSGTCDLTAEVCSIRRSKDYTASQRIPCRSR